MRFINSNLFFKIEAKNTATDDVVDYNDLNFDEFDTPEMAPIEGTTYIHSFIST